MPLTRACQVTGPTMPSTVTDGMSWWRACWKPRTAASVPGPKIPSTCRPWLGSSGFAYGVDMTDEMLELARANAARVGAANVEFRKGQMEELPLPDASVDVVISNCVTNLSVDKPAVLAELFRVLMPGGRIGIADVVAEDHMSPADRAAAGSYAGCIAGALSRAEYLDGLTAAGFANPSVTFTAEAAPGMHSAIIRAVKPAA